MDGAKTGARGQSVSVGMESTCRKRQEYNGGSGGRGSRIVHVVKFTPFS